MRVQASVLIHCPAEAVFECMTSLPFLEQWVAPFRVEIYNFPPESGYREVHHTFRIPQLHQVTEGAMGVGTIFKQSNELKVHPLEATIEITEYEPARVFALTVMTDAYTYQTKWVLQGTASSTRVIWPGKQQFRGWWPKLVVGTGLFALRFFAGREKLPGSPQPMDKLR